LSTAEAARPTLPTPPVPVKPTEPRLIAVELFPPATMARDPERARSERTLIPFTVRGWRLWSVLTVRCTNKAC